MTAYRNDAEARELVLEHLESENKRLVKENMDLRVEVERLRIIGRELLKSDYYGYEALRDKKIVRAMFAAEMAQEVGDLEARHRAEAELADGWRSLKRWSIGVVAVALGGPVIVKMLTQLL